MIYLLGVVCALILFLVLHFFTELAKKQKLAISISLLLIIILAALYNAFANSKTEQLMNIVTKFNQHQTLSCDGAKINDKGYTLSLGTHTFIGKKDTPFYGKMVSASECE